MNLVRTRQLAVLTSTVLLAACGGDSGTSPTPTPTPTPRPTNIPSPPPTSKVVLGYWIADPSSSASLASYFGYLNVVSAQAYNVTSDGGITGGVPSDLVSFDTARGIRTYACVTNLVSGAFNADLAHAAIVTNKAKTVQNLVALAASGFTGINVDLEGLWTKGDIKADRAAFTAFIAELGPALHARGLKLAISVPAKEADNPADDWSYPFDFAAIGSQADLIQLMTYDQHQRWSGGPGPVAGRDWMERCIVFAKGLIPPSKLVTGLPAYGYNWDLDNPSLNTDFAWTYVPTLLNATGASVQYEASSDSPFIAYIDSSGHRHQAWFENAQSIQIKSALVKKHGLAGVSMWRLGTEDLSFWTAVRAGLD